MSLIAILASQSPFAAIVAQMIARQSDPGTAEGSVAVQAESPSTVQPILSTAVAVAPAAQVGVQQADPGEAAPESALLVQQPKTQAPSSQTQATALSTQAAPPQGQAKPQATPLPQVIQPTKSDPAAGPTAVVASDPLQGTKIQPQTPVAQVQLADPNASNLATVEGLRQTEVSADSPRPTKLPTAQRATPTTKPEDVLSLEVKAIRQVANVQSGDQDSLAGLANGAASTVAAHRSSAPESPAMTGTTGQPSQVPVADQITDSLRESTIRVGQQITIRLNPPELGAVRLTLQSDGKEIHGTLQVDNHRVLGELQHQAASLMNRLAEDGIQMRKLDISLNDRGPTDSGQGFQQHAGSPYKDPQPWAENLPVSRSLLAEASPPEPETVVQAGPPSDSSLVNVMI